MPDQAENKIEQSQSDSRSAAPESAVKEADAGRSDLVKEQKQHSDFIKQGGSTGITEEFGKPGFFDSTGKDAIAGNSATVKDSSAEYAKAGEKPAGASDDPQGVIDHLKGALNEYGKAVTPDMVTDQVGAKTGDKSGKANEIGYTTDAHGNRQGDLTTPQGEHYRLNYDKTGALQKVTMPDENGKPTTYEYDNGTGKWMNTTTKPPTASDVQGVSVNGDNITIQRGIGDSLSGRETIYADGRKETIHLNKDGFEDEKHVRDANSHIERVYKPAGAKDPDSYDVKDNNGHTQKVEKDGNGWKVSSGDKSEHYDKLVAESNGDLKLTGGTNGKSLDVKTDGSMIERDKAGHITRESNADGISTTFQRDEKGLTTGVEVSDDQGHRIETRSGDIKVNDKDGSYTVGLEDGNKATRKLDGTEEIKDKDGKHVDSEADKLVRDIKPPLSPEEAQRFKADMAQVEKLPPGERKKVEDSLEKVVHGQADTQLTDAQRKEIATSLAHQVAHPESIHQGNKMTCTLANAEQTLARNHPGQYAEMVSGLAVDGKYTTPGPSGKTIEAQRDENGHLAANTDSYGQRSSASELFQNGAAQLAMPEGATYKSYTPGSPEAEKTRPADVDPSSDTGERVQTKDGNQKFNGYDADKEAEILNRLTPGDHYSVTEPIQTPDDLQKALDRNGGPPMNVGIHLGKDAKFTGMSASEGAAGSGYHAVNITHIETGPDGKKYVYYENPAGGTDHSWPNGKGVPADEFVKSMQSQPEERPVLDKNGDPVYDIGDYGQRRLKTHTVMTTPMRAVVRNSCARE
jgi:YD repeat-containing protein